MKNQKLIITIDENSKFNLTMDPPLAGEKSKEFLSLSEDEKKMQRLAANIAMVIVDKYKPTKQ